MMLVATLVATMEIGGVSVLVEALELGQSTVVKLCGFFDDAESLSMWRGETQGRNNNIEFQSALEK